VFDITTKFSYNYNKQNVKTGQFFYGVHQNSSIIEIMKGLQFRYSITQVGDQTEL